MAGEINLSEFKFPVERVNHIGVKALSTLDSANYWLSLHDGFGTAISLYDKYFEENEPRGLKRLITQRRVDSQLLSELVAGASWSSHILNTSPQTTMSSIESSFEDAKKEFSSPYACDAAVIAESNGVSVQDVVTLIKDLKKDPRIVKEGFKHWSTAVTLASAILAVGQENQTHVIDNLIQINKLTGGKYNEMVYSPLLQASLLTSPEDVVRRMSSLESITIKPKGFLRKYDEVSQGSKGFLVLTEILGNIREDEIVTAMKDLTVGRKLPQDTATRYILSQVNKTSDTPILNRQGVFNGKTRVEYDFFTLPFPLEDGIPLGDGMIKFKQDKIPYVVAIRLGGN